MNKNFLVKAAVSGIFASFSASVAIATDTVKCNGGNSCKGKSACNTEQNACKGQNSCKGKGYVFVKDEKACKALGGKVAPSSK